MSHRYTMAPVLALLAACAPSEQRETAAPAPNVVTFTATDFAFAGPDTIPAGLTTFRLENHGAEPHHIMVTRLDSGKTIEDLGAAMAADHDAIPPWTVWSGGVNVVMPHASAEATSSLEPGNYAALCFVFSPDGTMHVDKGMVATFTVTGEAPAVAAPAADIEMRLVDFAFQVSKPFAGGTQVVRVTNGGAQIHEVGLVKLHDDVTVAQFLEATAPGATTPPPGDFIGGTGALSTGGTSYWTVTLAPGRYALVCWVPTPDGVPHVMKGMAQEVTIG